MMPSTVIAAKARKTWRSSLTGVDII